MSRFAFMLHRPRRTLAALATALAATSLTVASGADFTATAANPANTFSAGTLTISNSLANAAVLEAAGMRPGGDPVEGIVDIANTGSLAGDFTLTRGTPVDSDPDHPLSAQIELEIRDCGAFDGATAPACGPGDGTEVYAGRLADLDAAAELGAYDGGERHRFRFAAALAGSAGNEHQGDTSSVTFTWDAA